MRRENDEETLDILYRCFQSLKNIGIRSKYTEIYLDSAKHMYALQKALHVINSSKYVDTAVEIESLEEILSNVDFNPYKA